jgi:hypothetical protein
MLVVHGDGLEVVVAVGDGVDEPLQATAEFRERSHSHHPKPGSPTQGFVRRQAMLQ